ncbi:hypothetical protein MmiEs2_07940 [Methanimicrococcus stummii]|uniref:Uncharacterized protein n=1 Tax=Methanimicrococcus stummii TaxID=3028294 RepID=A0AA97A828_9EURY|nr:hypothetical protein [Methanimicrococcus sp. Es2]WNY28598.1 hypothetical protein MmiEs2_07940 [Methanimicrococcus sp. Es2]
MLDKKNEDRYFNKECPFKKELAESRITGMLSVDKDRDNESAVTINEDTTLEFTIPGIRHIHLQRDEGIVRDYVFLVYGHCPEEFEEVEISFKDGTGEVRTLKISSRENKWHTERFESEDPNISEIRWDYKTKN